MKGFLNFVRQQGVVGLAVGLAIGLAAADAVSVLSANFIDPIVSWVLGWIVSDASALGAMTVTLGSGEHALSLGWGAILSAVINLLAVAFVVYGLVKWMKLDKIDKKAK
jgi:large conductance mechanosensitive channel